MKIGIVSQSYYPRYGGVTEHVHHTALELRKRGHEVVIITSHFRRGEANHADGVVRIGYNLLIPFNGAFVDLAVGLRLGRQLRDLISDRGFDVLHTHAPLVPTLPLMAIRAASCPQVGTFHTTAGRSRMLEWACSSVLDRGEAGCAHGLDHRATSPPATSRVTMRSFRTASTSIARPDVQPFAEFKRDGVVNLLFVGRLIPARAPIG